MRWGGLLGSALVVTACTSPNPAFESTDETSGQGQTASDAGEITGAQQTTEVGQDTTAEASDGTSDGDELPVPLEDYCRSDLLAVTDAGALYLLDLDAVEAFKLVEDDRLKSWAIATDEQTRVVYVSELADPRTVWRVNPLTGAIDEAPLTVPNDTLDEPLARATIHPNGDLWLGTNTNNRFVWFSPGSDEAGEILSNPIGWGGDMVFLDQDCAVVPTIEGMLHSVCFVGEMATAPPLTVNGMPPGVQFTGIAVDGMGRIWMSATDLSYLFVEVHRSGDSWSVVTTVLYEDIFFNDLAPLVLPTDC